MRRDDVRVRRHISIEVFVSDGLLTYWTGGKIFYIFMLCVDMSRQVAISSVAFSQPGHVRTKG